MNSGVYLHRTEGLYYTFPQIPTFVPKIFSYAMITSSHERSECEFDIYLQCTNHLCLRRSNDIGPHLLTIDTGAQTFQASSSPRVTIFIYTTKQYFYEINQLSIRDIFLNQLYHTISLERYQFVYFQNIETSKLFCNEECEEWGKSWSCHILHRTQCTSFLPQRSCGVLMNIPDQNLKNLLTYRNMCHEKYRQTWSSHKWKT